MREKIFLTIALIAFVFINSLKAQEYEYPENLFTEGTEWVMKPYTNPDTDRDRRGIYWTGTHLGPGKPSTTITIGSQEYQWLHESTILDCAPEEILYADIIARIYSKDGKVYVYDEEKVLSDPSHAYGQDFLVYDFTLQPGETAWISVFPRMFLEPIFEDIPVFEVMCMERRPFISCGRRYDLMVMKRTPVTVGSPIYWISGIGALIRLNSPFQSTPLEFDKDLIELDHVIHDGEVVFDRNDMVFLESEVSSIKADENPGYEESDVRFGIDGKILDENASGIFVKNGKKFISK